MADVLTGKVYTLGSGTLGAVTTQPLVIDKIRITWSGASAGNVHLTTNELEGTTDSMILHAKTLALASGNVGLATQEFDMNRQVFRGITKVAATGVSAETGIQIQLA